MSWLEQAAQLTIVLGFLGTVFTFAVVRPLQNSMEDLKSAITGLREDLNLYADRIHILELDVTELKTHIKSFTRRIDALEATVFERLGHG